MILRGIVLLVAAIPALTPAIIATVTDPALTPAIIVTVTDPVLTTATVTMTVILANMRVTPDDPPIAPGLTNEYLSKAIKPHSLRPLLTKFLKTRFNSISLVASPQMLLSTKLLRTQEVSIVKIEA
jgi:hypothetical protein